MDKGKPAVAAVAAWMAVAAAPAAAAPPNDLFESATPLGDAPVSVAATTVGASRQEGEPLHGQQTVWYAFRPTAGGRVAVEFQAPDGSERIVAVYTGPALATLARTGIAQGGRGRVAFDAVAGETYWISGARTYQSGPFALRIRPLPLPANDAFDDAHTLPVPGAHAGNLADATAEFGEQDAEHSVWYRLRPRRTGRLRVDASGECATVSVYEGRRVDELELVERGGSFSFRARRGRVYRAAVDCRSPVFGDYALRVSDGSIAGEGISLTVDAGQTLDAVRARGLRMSVAAARRAEVALELRVSRSTARRLGLDDRVIGRARGTTRPAAGLPAVVRLTRRAKRALEGETSLDATVRLELRRSKSPDRFLSVPVSL